MQIREEKENERKMGGRKSRARGRGGEGNEKRGGKKVGALRGMNGKVKSSTEEKRKEGETDAR